MLVAAPTLGCGDDPAPTFIDIRWQVRCQLSGGCVNIPDRDINNLDGEDGHRLACAVNRTADGNQILSFSAFKGTEYGIELVGATFATGGGAIMGSGCLVSVLEGNVHEGSCTSNVPTDVNPCQVNEIAITNEPDGPTVSGKIFCQQLSALADRGIQREVTAPGTDPGAAMQGAEFRLVNCDGL